MRIKFSRHQHDTVIEPKTEWGGSRQQLFRRYCDSSGWRNNRQHRKSLLRNQIIIIKNKNALCLSVNVFSTKALIGDTIFYVSNWRRASSRRSDGGDGAKKCEQRKKNNLFSTLFFSALSSFRTALHYPNAWNRLTSVALMSAKENV